MVFRRSFSILEINSVKSSTVLILDLSIASSDSHESVSIIFLASLGSWNIFLQFFKELNGLVVTFGDLVGDLFMFHTSH